MISGRKFACALIEAGVVPDVKITRIVIDLKMEGPIMVYYETHADGELIDLCLEELIKRKKDLTIKKT